MKAASWKWLFTAVVCFVFSGTAWANHAITWRTVAPGLEYTRLDGFTNFPQGYVHAFRISLDQYHLKVSPLPDNDEPETGFYRLMAAENAVVASNGGFFTPELKPLGLRITEGELLNPLKSTTWWSVFFIRNQKAYLVPQENYKPDKHIAFAIEAGPRLVVDSQVVTKLKTDIDSHTAIGITSSDKIILLATENILISTADLAKLMQQSQQQGGLDCVAAMNLDGGHSTQMYTKLPKFLLKISSHTRVADAVLVIPGVSQMSVTD